jgi:hypothetical protein
MSVSTLAWRRRSVALLAACAASLTALVALGAAPAHAVDTPQFSGYDCGSEPARFFQLRSGNPVDGYTQLWEVDVTDPAGTSPTVSSGGWKLIHSFTGSGDVNPVAIAARTTISYSGDYVTYLYYSGQDGNLYEGWWSPSLSTAWTSMSLTTSGVHKYTSLAYDDGWLWGVKSGDLYKMNAGANKTTPTSWSLAKSSFGSPQSFYGMPGSRYVAGYTGASGELRYLKSDGSFSTLRSSGYDTTLLAGIGDGLTYRFLSADTSLQRQTVGAIDGTITPISDLNMVNPWVSTPVTTAPITAVSDQCVNADASARADMIARAQSWANVQYSQSKLQADLHDGYRRDCSGFVSMVWQLPTTGGGPDTTALGTSTYSHAISWSQLKPGDALLNPGTHVRLFEAWYDDAHTQYWYYEMGDPSTDWNHDHTAVQTNVYTPIRRFDM